MKKTFEQKGNQRAINTERRKFYAVQNAESKKGATGTI
jgi:hypothetical protein